jgi:hypothetical protein
MSPKKRTKIIRKNKKVPNKANLKKNEKRIQENIRVLQSLAETAKPAEDAPSE